MIFLSLPLCFLFLSSYFTLLLPPSRPPFFLPLLFLLTISLSLTLPLSLSLSLFPSSLPHSVALSRSLPLFSLNVEPVIFLPLSVPLSISLLIFPLSHPSFCLLLLFFLSHSFTIAHSLPPSSPPLPLLCCSLPHFFSQSLTRTISLPPLSLSLALTLWLSLFPSPSLLSPFLFHPLSLPLPPPSGEGPLGSEGGHRHLLGGRHLHRAGDTAASELPSGLHLGGEWEACGRGRAAVEELDAAAEHLPHSPGRGQRHNMK